MNFKATSDKGYQEFFAYFGLKLIESVFGEPRHTPLPKISRSSSRGTATVDQIPKSRVRFPLRSEILSSPRVVSHFLTRANAQWEIHGFSITTNTAGLIL